MPSRTNRAIDIEGATRVPAEAEREYRRSQELIAETHRLLERIVKRCAAIPAEGRKLRPIRNKLFYKHRWLISANMIAALRRAGVDCNIVLPPALAAPHDGLSTAVSTSPESSTDETLH